MYIDSFLVFSRLPGQTLIDLDVQLPMLPEDNQPMTGGGWCFELTWPDCLVRKELVDRNLQSQVVYFRIFAGEM